jgi:hypothetical protein
LVWTLLIIFGVIFPLNAFGDRTFRCKGRIVSIGEYTSEVLEKCGEPDNREQWEESYNEYISQIYDYKTERYRAPRLIRGPIRMERWTYNFGATKFIRHLKFKNGELINIETGDKGSN